MIRSSADPQAATARRSEDGYPASRVARLAWFEIADAATRRALARQQAHDPLYALADARH
ncbi:MAG: hypothetical protein RLY86_1059 [Pseudomonadota bacterium]